MRWAVWAILRSQTYQGCYQQIWEPLRLTLHHLILHSTTYLSVSLLVNPSSYLWLIIVESHNRIAKFLACMVGWAGSMIITSLAGGQKKDKKMKGHVSWLWGEISIQFPDNPPQGIFAAFDSMSDMTSRISVEHNSWELRMPHNSCISTKNLCTHLCTHRTYQLQVGDLELL